MGDERGLFRLDGKVAVVTGASRGIGRVIAEALAAQGADLVLVSRREENLQQTRKRCEAAGRRVMCVGADLGAEGSEAIITETVVSGFGRVDVLVNNAGISPVVVRAEKVTRAAWDDIIRTNLTGTFFVTQALAAIMVAQGGGSIVTMTSIGASRAIFGLAPYCASKAALDQLTRSLAFEWASVGVRVNAVAPAFVETDLNLKLREQGGRFARDALERTPLGRFARPEEVVGAVVYLASDAASYVTGHTLYVDGGWSTK